MKKEELEEEEFPLLCAERSHREAAKKDSK
jgi:hypothetical protein